MDSEIRDLELQWKKDPTRDNEYSLYRALYKAGRLTSDWAPGVIPPVLNDYNWREAFGYAGESDTCAGNKKAQFTRADVRRIIAISEGEHDGNPWLILVQLWDGNYGALQAWD
jgi:hypothetical protein